MYICSPIYMYLYIHLYTCICRCIYTLKALCFYINDMFGVYIYPHIHVYTYISFNSIIMFLFLLLNMSWPFKYAGMCTRIWPRARVWCVYPHRAFQLHPQTPLRTRASPWQRLRRQNLHMWFLACYLYLRLRVFSGVDAFQFPDKSEQAYRRSRVRLQASEKVRKRKSAWASERARPKQASTAIRCIIAAFPPLGWLVLLALPALPLLLLGLFFLFHLGLLLFLLSWGALLVAI